MNTPVLTVIVTVLDITNDITKLGEKHKTLEFTKVWNSSEQNATCQYE